MTALIYKLFFCINFLGETQKSASKKKQIFPLYIDRLENVFKI